MMSDAPAMPHHADREALAHALEIRADAFRELGFNAVEIAGMVRGSAWRTIESAPRDRFILLFCAEDRSTWLAKWQGSEWYGIDCEHGLRRTGQSIHDPDYVTGWFVTHWMPRPSPPNLEAVS